MFEEFQLPDGSVATSALEVDRYLQKTGSALASDYSGDFLKNRRFFLEKARQDDFLADFVRNYKKFIWMDKI